MPAAKVSHLSSAQAEQPAGTTSSRNLCIGRGSSPVVQVIKGCLQPGQTLEMAVVWVAFEPYNTGQA